MTEKMQLEKYGYTVRTVSTGEKAVEAVNASSDIDLILMDINLGNGIDGTQAAEIILKDHDIPIVFLSSHTEPEIVEKTEKITSYGYVVKNSSVTVLDASIKMAFRLFETRRLANDTFTHSINGLCVHRLIRDESGNLHDCEYLRVNGAFERHTGLFSRNVIGRTIRDLFPGSEADDVIRLYDEVLSGRADAQQEICFKPTQTWYEISIFRTHEDEFTVVVHNITKRKSIEEELLRNRDLLERTQQLARIGGWVWDIESQTMTWTDQTYRIHGMTPGEFAPGTPEHIKASLACYDPADRKVIEAAFGLCAASGQPYDLEFPLTRIDGSRIWIRTMADAEKQGDRVVRVFGNIIDITERKQAEDEVRRFKTISDNAVYGKAIADLQGNLLYINRFFANIHGYEPEDLIGKHFSLFHNEQQTEVVESLIASMIREGHFSPEPVWHCHKDGTEFPMLMSGILLKDDYGNPQYIAASAVDMSSQMQAEDRYRLLFDLSNDAIIVHGLGDDNRPTRNIEVNEQATRLLGYTREELLSMSASDVVPEKHASTMYLHGQELMEKKHLTFESENIRSDGAVIPIEVSAHLYTEDNKKFVVSSIRDITERKQAEKALAQKSKLLEKTQALANLGSWEWDLVHDTWCFSEQWKDIHGVSDNDFDTAKLMEIAHPEDAPYIEKAFSDAKEQGKTYDIEHRIIRADNREIRSVKALGNVEFDQDTGRPVRMVGAVQDITDRKQAEKEIQKQLAEKETLLREVHHRVKNNMATIESLLSLQASSTAHAEVKVALQDTISRVQSTRVLYDRLLLSDDLHGVSIKSYAEGLIDSLVMVFDSGKNITIEKHISDFVIDAKKVFLVGIIVNELLTNVFKFAFKDRKEGQVSVSIDKEESVVTLIIQDNGVGFDARALEKKSPGFGLTVVRMLVEQSGGTYSLSNDHGARSVVRFQI